MTNVPYQEWEPSWSEGDRLVEIQNKIACLIDINHFLKTNPVMTQE